MGRINRHLEAPHIDGEELTGQNLEADVVNAFNELSGGVDDANLSALADLSGSKFLDGSVAGSRLKELNVLTAKIAADAITGAKLDGTTDNTKMATGFSTVVMGTDVSPTALVASGYTDLNSVAIAVAADSRGVLVLCLRFINPDDTGSLNAWTTRVLKDKPSAGSSINTGSDPNLHQRLTPSWTGGNGFWDYKKEQVEMNQFVDRFNEAAGDGGKGETVTYTLSAIQSALPAHTIEETVMIAIDLVR